MSTMLLLYRDSTPERIQAGFNNERGLAIYKPDSRPLMALLTSGVYKYYELIMVNEVYHSNVHHQEIKRGLTISWQGLTPIAMQQAP